MIKPKVKIEVTVYKLQLEVPLQLRQFFVSKLRILQERKVSI